MTPAQHQSLACSQAKSFGSDSDKWIVVGEWTGAMTDCTPYLNGYGVGARYDGSFPGSSYVGSCSGKNDITTWSQQFKDDMRAFVEAQLTAYESQTQGWVWWNFKAENADEWDAFVLLDNGIFPQPLSDRKFGAICS